MIKRQCPGRSQGCISGSKWFENHFFPAKGSAYNVHVIIEFDAMQTGHDCEIPFGTGSLSNRISKVCPHRSVPSPRHPKARQRRWDTTPSSRSSARRALVWLTACHTKLQCHQQHGRHPAWQPRRLVRFLSTGSMSREFNQAPTKQVLAGRIFTIFHYS